MSLGYIYMHACVNGFVFHLRKLPFPISYSCHMGSIESYMYTCHTHGLLESFLSKKKSPWFLYISLYCLQIYPLNMYSFFSFHLGIYLHFAYSIACMHECTHAHKHSYTDFLALLLGMSPSLFPFLPCLPTFEPIRHVQPSDIATQFS